MRADRHSRAGRWIAAAALLGLAGLAGGCQVAGVVADVVSGGGSIDAVYEPTDRTTLVLVDDPGRRLSGGDLSGLIAGRIRDALIEEKVVEHVVPTTMVQNLRQQHDNFSQWPIDKVGQHAGAEQVIYVAVEHFQLTEAGAIYRPRAAVRVKVIDVASGARLFPSPRVDRGYPVQVEQHYRDMSGATPTTESLLSRDLAEHLAAAVAKLFYKHKPPQTGDQLPG